MADSKGIGAYLDALVKGTLEKTTGLDGYVGTFEQVGLDANIGGIISKATDLDAYLVEHHMIPSGSVAWDYTGQVGSVSPGEYVVGDASGAKGLLVNVYDAGTTGTLYFDTIDGSIQAGETLYRWPLSSIAIPNGDMELDASWELYGTGVTENRNATQKHSGDYSWYVYVASAPHSGIQSATFTTVTGGLYTLDFWAFPDYLDPITVRIISGDGNFLSDTTFDPGTSDIWYNYQVEFEETAGGSSAQVMFLTPSTNTSTWRYYIDDATLTALTKDTGNYVVASGSAYNPKPHLDALLKKKYLAGTTGLDAHITAMFGLDAKLPTLKISAKFGKYITFDARLPALSIESRFGAQLDAKLPALEIEASIVATERLSVDAKLPVITAESRFGLRGKPDLKLPALEIEAAISGGSAFRMDRSLPPLEIDAAISTPGVFSVDKSLPPLEISAAISREQHISLDATLPALKIESSMGTYVFDVDALLPPLKLESLLSRAGALSLDATLPAISIDASMLRTSITVADGRLPALTIDAGLSTENTISLDSSLPALKISSKILRTSISVDDGQLPALTIEAALSREGSLSVDSTLPPLSIVAAVSREARLSVDSTLPAMKINASMDNYSLSVDATLPAIKISSALHRNAAIAVDAKLPYLTMDAAISAAYGLNVDAKLPAFKITGHIYSGQDNRFSVDARLPQLTIESTGTVGTFLSVDATLPAIIMGAVGTGGVDGSGGGITKTGRFDDYILRYSR